MYKEYEHEMKCPKCGSDLITTEYLEHENVMKRKCSNCGYTEKQLPLDRKGTV